MKKLITIYGLLLVLFPFLVKPIKVKALDYDYFNYKKITTAAEFNEEIPKTDKVLLIDYHTFEYYLDDDTSTDYIGQILAVIDTEEEPNVFDTEITQTYTTWVQKGIGSKEFELKSRTAYFFGTGSKENFLSSNLKTASDVKKYLNLTHIVDYYEYQEPIPGSEASPFTDLHFQPTKIYKPEYQTIRIEKSFKLYGIFKIENPKGNFELRKIDQIAQFKNPPANTPKTIFNYAYTEQKFDANFNLEPTDKRTLFASYAETEFNTYISQQEQKYQDFFANIKPTRQTTEIKAYSEIQIQGKTVQIPWYSSPLTKTEGTLAYDINGKLHIFFNDTVLNEVKKQRQKQFEDLPMVRNTEVKPTDTFKDPNDLYQDYAKNYEEAKSKPFITSIEEFENTVDTSDLEIQDPTIGTWYSWKDHKNQFKFNKTYKIKETHGSTSTTINVSFYTDKPEPFSLSFYGEIKSGEYKNLEFGKVIGNYQKLHLNFQAFPPTDKDFGIDYRMETYYSATDNSYDYTKYENISDPYSYVDDINEYEITKYGYYVFRLFNSLTSEVIERRLHYAPLVDAETEEKLENDNYHYTQHSVNNVKPHINDLDTYEVYYSADTEITQDNFHSHNKLDKDDFGNPISPNIPSSKFFKKGYYLVKYKAKTEDTYKFTQFEIGSHHLQSKFYSDDENIEQIQPYTAFFTNKPFKISIKSTKEHWQLAIYKYNEGKLEVINGEWNNKEITENGIYKIELKNLQNGTTIAWYVNKSTVLMDYTLENPQQDTSPNAYISANKVKLTLKQPDYQLTVENKTAGQNLVQNEHKPTFEFDTEVNILTEYLVKITDKYGNKVEFTVKIDKRTPKLGLETPDNQPATPKLEHLGLPNYDTNLKLTKSATDSIVYSKNNSAEVQYNGEILTQGVYTATITNKLGLKTAYQFAIYTTTTNITTEINTKTQVIGEQSQEFYTNSALPGQFTFTSPVNWETLTVYEVKGGIETKLLKANTDFKETLTIQELANLTQNSKFKYVFTDIFGKTREFTVERNTEISDLDIQGVNQQNKTNGEISISHPDPKAKLFVNGTEQPLPHKITENGKYELKLVDKFGNEKTYTVERNKQELMPTLKDLENNKPIQGEETGKTAYFNLESDWQLYEFQENEWKLVENRPGKVVLDKHQTYQYKIVDSFGNEKVIKLTVSLEIGEIKHNLTRPEQFLTNKPATFNWQDPSITAVLKETNEPYTKGSAIEKPGKYTLVFADKFSHTEEITFEYRPKLDKIELISNNQRTVLKHSTIAVNHNFKFDTTNDLFLFNKGKWQPITPNYEFSKEATYKFKATDKFGNETTFTVQYKHLATIKKEENKLTVIVGSIVGAIIAILIIIFLVLKIKNNAKNSPFKQKKTPNQQSK